MKGSARLVLLVTFYKKKCKETALAIFICDSDGLIKFEARFNDIREELHSIFNLEIRGRELNLLWEQVKLLWERV